jgi:hypothetical protein
MLTVTKTWVLAGLLVVVAMVAACGQQKSQGSAAAPPVSGPRRVTTAHQLKRSEMTAAEQKYGMAPVPDASVTYQPDVIIVGGGAEAIRSQSSNGFIWTIDGSAPHAAELAPGKILFMTNRAVGRVLDVSKNGDDLVVVVGPVDITELVREAHIEIADMPVDFGEALSYTTPDFPGQVVLLAQSSAENSPTAMMRSVAFVKTTGPAPTTQSGTPSTPDVTSSIKFKTVPVASSDGVGMRATSNEAGLKLESQVLLHLARPTLDVHIDIVPKTGVRSAYVTLKGAAGLKWQFAAGTDVGRRANVKVLLTPDTDFSFPVGGIGPLPLAITVRQRFEVETALGVRNTTLSATGDYSFNGEFRAGWINGQWEIGVSVGFSTKQSLLTTGSGVSIGANGVVFAHQLKVIAGLGVAGFVAGPYLSISSAASLTKGSDLGMVRCQKATLLIRVSGGVGYAIPQSIANLTNAVLKALNIKYEIVGDGGFQNKEPRTMVNKESHLKGCEGGKEDNGATPIVSAPHHYPSHALRPRSIRRPASNSTTSITLVAA